MRDRVEQKHYPAGEPGFRAMCEHTRELGELSLAGRVEDFHATGTSVYLGSVVAMHTTTCAFEVRRTALHIARSGLDHLLLHIVLDGCGETVTPHRTTRFATGDIVAFDLSRTSDTRVWGAGAAMQSVTLCVPRAQIAPRLAVADAAHGARISAAFGRSALLRDLALAAVRYAGDLGAAESDAVAHSLVTLVAACLGASPHDPASVPASSGEDVVVAIKRHVEQHLCLAAVEPDAICRTFGISRATLYRWFEPEQGFARYVQSRRLHHALARLTRDRDDRLRITDLALEYGFASDATFIRAFRRLHGLTPGEARRQARCDCRPYGNSGDERVVRWMHELAGSAPLRP